MTEENKNSVGEENETSLSEEEVKDFLHNEEARDFISDMARTILIKAYDDGVVGGLKMVADTVKEMENVKGAYTPQEIVEMLESCVEAYISSGAQVDEMLKSSIPDKKDAH